MRTFVLILALTVARHAAARSMDLAPAHQLATRTVPFRGWNGSPHLPPPALQAPLGACQSFAMTGFLEYIAYHYTGQAMDFSEKYTAWQVLRHLIRHGEAPPSLSQATDPIVLSAITAGGVLPEAAYPWGRLESDAVPTIDTELFLQVFERHEAVLDTPEAYERALADAFLFPPPERFLARIAMPVAGETRTVRTPGELGRLLRLDKANFSLAINGELAPFFTLRTRSEREAAVALFSRHAQDNGVAFEVKSRSDLARAIVASLERRMVVNVAADVWKGDWASERTPLGHGGHAMTIVGYFQEGDRLEFKLRNSWGGEIGAGGYQRVSAEVLLPNVFYATFFTPPAEGFKSLGDGP